MYNDYFNAIKTTLKNDLKQIVTVDWYNKQYHRGDNLEEEKLPACFVEFENSIKWEDVGNKSQLAETTITFHMVTFFDGDSPETLMTLAQQFHQVMQGKSLFSENKNLSTSMSRTESELIMEYDQLKVMKIGYKTALFDDSSVPNYSKINVAIKVE